MSAKTDRLTANRTWEEHRAIITKRTDLHGDTQDAINAICKHLTNLNAAVAKLIDAEIVRRRRRK